jgi:hypothetical protein
LPEKTRSEQKVTLRILAGGRRQEAEGRRQEAGGRRQGQKAGGRKEAVGGFFSESSSVFDKSLHFILGCLKTELRISQLKTKLITV